jgi:two-component system sensor histidine kinase MtrB
MVSKFSAWRKSLTFRIAALLLIFTLAIISTTGAILYSRIQSGLYREKLTTSKNLYSTISSAIQFQAILFTPTKKSKLKDRFESIFSPTNVGLGSSDHEIILLPAANNKHRDFIGTSDGVDPTSVSSNFQNLVEKSNSLESEKTTLQYIGGSDENAYAVGSVITIPLLGNYQLYVLFPLRDVENSLVLVKNYIAITGIILMFLIALITALVIQRALKPVREAALIAEEFTSGKLDRRILIKGDDEMARLGRSFNEMAVVLSRHINQLENLSRLQQRFVSDVSHELRTPLTTMKMAAGVLYGSRENYPPAIARSAELLQGQMERFEKLLTDLLEVSRFDAHAATMELTRFDLVATMVKTIDYLLGLDCAFLKLELPTSPVYIEADERRIERILRNLITNAIDHRNDKYIKITIKEDDLAVSVSVRDFGVGFSRKDAERVFERFWRADPSRARTSGGTGLGLAISQEDANLHGGKIEAWGRPFHGANFVLTLPKNNNMEELHHVIPVIPPEEISTVNGMDVE